MNLITGTTGLVGSHLALRLLENGENVRGLYRTASAQQKTRALFGRYGKEQLFARIEWVDADILDLPKLATAFTGVSRVFHCAALISFDPKEEERMRKVNIEGTANVVNLALEFGVSKLCHVSSVAALGDPREGGLTIDEETEWNPEKHHSDYAISKYGAEMEIWRGQQEGLSAVVVNPGIILGPGFWDCGSGALFRAIEKGFPFYTEGSTGFVAVTDVVAAMIALMESPVSSERFVLVGEHLVLREVAFRIADALQCKRPGIKARPWMVKLAVLLDYLTGLFGKKRKLFSETADALFRHRRFSSEKIRSRTGMDFKPILPYIDEVVAIEKGR